MTDDTIRFQDADHDLAGLEALTWDLLDKGARSGRDALHSGTLCTVSPDGFPAARTMVLRQVDPARRLLAAYGDVRAPLARGLATHPRASWVFYDARRRLEVRAMGTVRVFSGPDDALAAAVWAGMSPAAQHAFAGEAATGARLAARAAVPVLPTADEVAARSGANFGNFAVLLTAVTRLEFLYLHPAGHHRARFDYDDERLADAHWVST